MEVKKFEDMSKEELIDSATKLQVALHRANRINEYMRAKIGNLEGDNAALQYDVDSMSQYITNQVAEKPKEEKKKTKK